MHGVLVCITRWHNKEVMECSYVSHGGLPDAIKLLVMIPSMGKVEN